jgi:putative endonuclease
MTREVDACVYILTNWKHTVLYTGVTSDLARRLAEHRAKMGSKFTKQYNASKLVLVEVTDRIEDAIAREKQIKSWARWRKVELVNSVNPEWNDLYNEYLR